jgi:hypothetical protein
MAKDTVHFVTNRITAAKRSVVTMSNQGILADLKMS